MKLIRVFGIMLAGAATTIAWGQVIPGQYIAVFDDQVTDHPSAVRAAAAQHGLAVAYVYQHALKGFAFGGSPQAAAALARRPGIAYVEPDQVYHAWQQTIPTGISRAGVPETGIINGVDDQLNVDIAIIDSGIDTAHPDLRVVGGRRFYVQGLRLREDNNYSDDNGHGTHVAGTAAAIDNGLGVVGVAPGARLWAVKVLDRNGSGSLSGVIAGVDWVTARASTIEVANMSLGGGYSQAINDAVRRGTQAGIVFVVSAGNDNSDARNYSPASEPSAITVSALADSNGLPSGGGAATSYGADDTLASFSNYGPAVDICAPGVGILSTYPGGYATASGTSMASPHVAGAAALYMAAQSSRPTVAQVTTALLNSGWNSSETCCYFGGDVDGHAEPLLNVARLVGTMSGGNQPPTASFTYDRNNLEVTFTDTSTDPDGSILSWAWTFGDGSTSTEQHPSHIYAAADTYTVELTVTDDDGNSASFSAPVTVSAPSTSTIMLTASGYKVQGLQKVSLNWSGHSGNVTIYRDGIVIAGNVGGNSYTDNIDKRGGGSYRYQVMDGTNESNSALVVF